MNNSEDSISWHERLYALLESPDISDTEVIQFIEEEVPDEGDIIDYKEDLYLSASSGHHKRKRQSKLIKVFTAMANVRTQARHRYLCIGFDNDGNFVGMKYREPRDSDQILDVDDSHVRDVFRDKVSPTPNFEVFELEDGDNRGGVVIIHQGEQVPLVVEKTLRHSDGSAFVAAGQAYTRDGSNTERMGSDDFAAMMRYREELINEKITELTEGLSQVVGIPDDQLANLDLNVTPSEEGIAVTELITTDAPKTVEDDLKTAVKASKGSGGYGYDRKGLYEFFNNRDDLGLEEDDRDEKLEFLFRANLQNHFHGAYWLCEYGSEVDQLIERVLETDINGTVLPPLERVLLVLGKASYLDEINQNSDWNWQSSKAATYVDQCTDALHKRVIPYTDYTVKAGPESYSVRKLVYGNASKEPEELLDVIIENLLDRDSSVLRMQFREMELVYLAKNGG